METAALVPTSLIDFPRIPSAVLFTPGCNFRCPFCHNPELVLPEKIDELKRIPEEEVFGFLRERQGFLDGVVITGGEPTIHADLVEFIERVRSLGYRVKLDTNGSRPEVLSSLLEEGLVDYLAMDLKAAPSRYSELAGVPIDTDAIKESITLIMELAPDYEFRTTVAPTMTSQDLEVMAKLIDGAESYWLQQFVSPNDKGLVDPAWEGKAALCADTLRGIWDLIKTHVAGGGVR